MVGFASEATAPVYDRIPPPFNTHIRVAAAVEQFLRASLRCSFDDFKGQRRRLFIDWLVLDVGSLIDDSSIGTGNSYWILDEGLLEAEHIVTSFTVPSTVNKKNPRVKNLVIFNKLRYYPGSICCTHYL